MQFLTMGQPDLPALLFLHGLSATAESCYGRVGRLEKDWHIVLAELDGHYPGGPAFSTLDGACEEIEEYVTQTLGGKIHGLVGLSLGGTLAVSLLGRGRIEAERTILDAAFCVDMGALPQKDGEAVEGVSAGHDRAGLS